MRFQDRRHLYDENFIAILEAKVLFTFIYQHITYNFSLVPMQKAKKVGKLPPTHNAYLPGE